MNNTRMHTLAMNGKERVINAVRLAGKPLSAQEIAHHAGVPLSTAQARIQQLIQAGRMANLNTGSNKTGAYILTSGPAEVKAPPCAWRESPIYTGEKPIPMRPGAMDAFTKGSVEGGKWGPRVAPHLISYRG